MEKENNDKFKMSFDEWLKTKENLENSGYGVKIAKHIIDCPYCSHLASALGFLIEQHMKEKEQIEKLT